MKPRVPRRRTADTPVAYVVGTPSAERDHVIATLGGVGIATEVHAEDDLLGRRDPGQPALLVLDDVRDRAQRLATQRRLRAHPALHSVPLLVLNHDCSIDSFGGALAAGASAFLRLPGDDADLADAARRLAVWRGGGGGTAVRHGPRRPLLLDVDVDVPGAERCRGRIVDVSASGCRLELPIPAPEGATLGLIPRSCDDSTEIRLAGTVRWCRPRTSGGQVVAVRWTGTAGLVARRLLGLGTPGPAA